MAFYDPVTERLRFLRVLTPKGLKGLADARISELVLKELGRSRTRIDALTARYPSASSRELANRLIDNKKGLAGMIGGVSGVFGLASVPADLMVMLWLELVLLVDIATVHKVNLKSERSRTELLDLFGYMNGVGPMQRAGPKVLGKIATVLLERGGLSVVGRAVPLVAAPISAYLNSQHLQKIGDEAVRHYEGFQKVRTKAKGKKAS